MTFEEVVRIVAENGLVPAAEGRIEEWIVERVEMHRNPSGPKLQERSDGRWLQINERRTGNGSIVAVYEDVTELKRREEELAAASREKDAVLAELQEVLDAIDYGVLLMDADLNVRMRNGAYRKIWNISEDFHKPGERKTLLEYYQNARALYEVPDEDWEDMLEKRLQAIREGRTDPPENRLTDGKILKRECVSLSNGGRMLTYFDITELKRAQDALRMAKDEAESATRAKSQFLANMSHELRTPLNAVIGITELLKEEAEEDDHSDLVAPLQRVAGAGRHLLSLIDNILDLSKIEANRLELQVEDFDVTQMVQDVATTVEPLALQRSNRLSIRCDDDVGRMRSDATKIRQIMINILGNACKFTEDGQVELRVSRSSGNGEDWLTMEFSDTGIGIEKGHLEGLFKEFAQGDASATRRYGGTGLGLVISQRLSNILGGDIHVTSEPGVGTQFVVRLPLAFAG
jgi:signal transduction histidine kinase